MRKDLQGIITDNVLIFPRAHREREPRSTPIRQNRKAKQSNVLRFTGKKQFVFDRSSVLTKWAPALQATINDLQRRLDVGDLTGLMVVTTTDRGHVYDYSVDGVYCEDIEQACMTCDGLSDALSCLWRDKDGSLGE